MRSALVWGSAIAVVGTLIVAPSSAVAAPSPGTSVSSIVVMKKTKKVKCNKKTERKVIVKGKKVCRPKFKKVDKIDINGDDSPAVVRAKKRLNEAIEYLNSMQREYDERRSVLVTTKEQYEASLKAERAAEDAWMESEDALGRAEGNLEDALSSVREREQELREAELELADVKEGYDAGLAARNAALQNRDHYLGIYNQHVAERTAQEQRWQWANSEYNRLATDLQNGTIYLLQQWSECVDKNNAPTAACDVSSPKTKAKIDSHIAGINAQLDRWRDEQSARAADRADADARVKALNKVITEVDTPALNVAQAELDAVQKDFASIEKQMNLSTAKRDNAKAQYATAKTNVTAAQKAYDAAVAKNKAMVTAYETAVAKREDLETKYGKAENAMYEAEDNLSEAKSRYADAKAALKDAQGE